MKEWYLVQFKTNSHRLAERNLNRQGFKTFLPLQKLTKRKSLRFVSDLKPLFPGYMFVSVNEESLPLRKINSTIGVIRLVTFDNKPQSLPVQLVDSLLIRCDSFGKLLPQDNFKVGDSIKLLTGPFANFVANVEEIDAEHRIWVLMNFMGQKTKFQIMPDQLQIAR